MKQPTFSKTPFRPQPPPMQPPMRVPARMPVQQPPMRMPVQPARPQTRFQPAPRPIPPPRQPMQQARPMQQPMPPRPMQQPMQQPMPSQGRVQGTQGMQGVQGVLTGTRAPTQPQQQPQDLQAFRQQTINRFTPQQQQAYQDASRLGGGIDPLAVAMGGPNALQQAMQLRGNNDRMETAASMQTQMQGQSMQDQPTQGPDRNRIYSAEEQGQRQRLAEAQASMPPAVFNAVDPTMQGMGNQGNIMERLRQLLRGQQ